MYAPDIEKINNDPNYWRERSFAHESKVQEMREQLRDKFAMAALTGYLSKPDLEMDGNLAWAKDAYLMADAMLKAREVER